MKECLSFKKWGIYLILMLCVGFMSCSDDDEGGGGGGNAGVFGTTITITEDDETAECKISYDSQGRVSKIVSKWYDEYGNIEESETTTYTYSTDEITVVETSLEDDERDTETTVYELDNRGLICASYESYDSDYEYYEYDDKKRLISYGDPSYMNPVRWEGENIKTEYTYHTGYDYYTNKPDEKGLNGLEYGFTDEYGVLYMQGYFGKKSANLLKSDGNTSYTYTWDGGKVKTMSGTYYNSYYGDYERWTYTFNF